MTAADVQTWAHAFPDTSSAVCQPACASRRGRRGFGLARIRGEQPHHRLQAGAGRTRGMARELPGPQCRTVVGCRPRWIAAVAGFNALARIDAAGDVSWTTGTGAYAVAHEFGAGNVVVAGAGPGGIPAGRLRSWRRPDLAANLREQPGSSPHALVIGSGDAIYVSGGSRGVNGDLTTLKYSSAGGPALGIERASGSYPRWIRPRPPPRRRRPRHDFHATIRTTDGATVLRYSTGGALASLRHTRWSDYWADDRNGGIVGIGDAGISGAQDVRVERYDQNGATASGRASMAGPAELRGEHVRAGSSSILAARRDLAAITDDGHRALCRREPGEVRPRRAPPLGPTTAGVGATGGLAVDDFGSGVRRLPDAASANGDDLLVFKYTAAGDLAWSRNLVRGARQQRPARAIVIDGAGNLVVAGVTGPAASNDQGGLRNAQVRCPRIAWARSRLCRFCRPPRGDAPLGRRRQGKCDRGRVSPETERSTEFAPCLYDADGNERWTRFYLAGSCPAASRVPVRRIAASIDGEPRPSPRGPGTATTSTSRSSAMTARVPSPGSQLSPVTRAAATEHGRSRSTAMERLRRRVLLDGSHGRRRRPASFRGRAGAAELPHPPAVPRARHSRRGSGWAQSLTPSAGATRALKATGTCGIPETARALALNLTVTGATAPVTCGSSPAASRCPPPRAPTTARGKRVRTMPWWGSGWAASSASSRARRRERSTSFST